MEKGRDLQTRTESKTRLVEQINACLHAGDYARALGILQAAAAESPNDAELLELQKQANDGMKRNADANRLITESQELFAQQKSAEAIQLLRKAYELDKHNSLARAILANSLVEHAQSIVETDWLEAETLTNQALDLNPAHPTAKVIRNLIVDQKKNSSADDWVTQARKRQTGGDLFAALAWVAEGLAVHPDDPKLLQIQDEIQRDQSARRRQARRGDVEELRRMASKIDAAADDAAKQAIAERIQQVAAKYWTDGEILSIANALLLRLGLVPQEGSTSPQGKGAIIFHVPRPTAPEVVASASPKTAPSAIPPSPPSPGKAPVAIIPPTKVQPNQIPQSQAQPSQTQTSQISTGQNSTSQISTSQVSTKQVPPSRSPISKASVKNGAPGNPPSDVPRSNVPPSRAPADDVPPEKVLATPPEPQLPPASAPIIGAAELSAPAAKLTPSSSRPRPSERSNIGTLLLISAAVIILIAAIVLFVGKHHAPPVATSSTPASTVPVVSVPAPPTPAESPAPPAQPAPEPTQPVAPATPYASAKSGTADSSPSAAQSLGTLLVVAGQDNATVFLDGKLQRQLTQAGQLRIPNLELKDYVVQVSKAGFQDPPQQTVRIRGGELATVTFALQPQPRPQARLASLTIQGGAPGTTVLIDQIPVGIIQPDGTLSVSTVPPGDHTLELRKERFKPRQFKKTFVAGAAISLVAADAALEVAPAEVKITYLPADAKVALVNGDRLVIVNSGVPINLAPGTYTLTARTADSFTRSSSFEVVAGQSKTLDLSLAPNGMSKWDDPGAWRREGDSFIRRGGEFVLYGVVPASGTYVFAAMPLKGHMLQWVLNYTDPRNYVLCQMDDNNFYRSVIRNGQKTEQIIVPDKSDKKSFRTLHIRVSPTEIVHQIRHGNSSTVLDRWTQPGTNLSLGKFGFYIPGNDEVALTSFAHYVDLNLP